MTTETGAGQWGSALAIACYFFDMLAYEAYHQGKLEDYEYPDELVQEAMTHLPKVPAFG